MKTNLQCLTIIAGTLITPGDTVSSILRKLVEFPGGSPGVSDADVTRRLEGVDYAPDATDEALVRILAGEKWNTDVNTTLNDLIKGIEQHVSA